MSRTTRGLRLQMFALRPNYFYSLLVNFESLPLIFCNLPRHAPSIRSSPETWPPLSGHRLNSTHPIHTLRSKSKANPFGVLIFLIVFFYAKVGVFLAWYRQVIKKWLSDVSLNQTFPLSEMMRPGDEYILPVSLL
jgi:hypothetical protein